MGLHICYDLSLPGETPGARILEVLGELRTLASRPGVRVTPMLQVTLATLLSKPPFVWHNLDRFFPFWASLQLRERDGTVEYRDADRDRITAIGFAIHPGHGSEAATFGFVRPLVETPASDAEVPEKCGAWYWHACCKTQYASVVSDEHLVRCHLLIVELLEALQRLGVEVDVRDETGYWETRSTARLITEVAKMNAIVARFAGAFHDAMPPGLRAGGAIFEHPEFERLETDGGKNRGGKTETGP